MLPACRIEEGFSIPTFDVVPSDVEGFMDELREFQAAFHDCFTRSEPREHFFDYLYNDTFAPEHGLGRRGAVTAGTGQAPQEGVGWSLRGALGAGLGTGVFATLGVIGPAKTSP
jgi:hypothetical protein